ncbi:hypothetical protein ONS95_006134 [Cadophora gregata]|uniref:uncharacterized protein n=1 Tax=Cadophora gregata TaxID=51156 RepID=UPI0026DDC6B8|nr:uncharacterized protein ONS95_006134 [Cadophora gregata]KAK0102520.1 hypothetical protein ONS95_006134 [Cadophora gregata]
MDDLRDGTLAMSIPSSTRLQQWQSFAETHLVALTCALMFASAFALPSFSSAALGLKGLYEFTLGLFMFSAVSFGVIYRCEIKEYKLVQFHSKERGLTLSRHIAPGLAVCMPFAFTALLTVRPSLKDFAPYMPISAAMGIMIIVYIVPWARKSFHARNTVQDVRLGEFMRAEHSIRYSGSDGASMGSDSTRSSGVHLWILNRFMGSEVDPLVFAHLGHAGHYDTSTIPPLWETISTGDLELGLHPGSSRTSTTSEDSTDPLLL